MAGKEVIRAAQMFTANGAASRISVVKEMVIGSALGLGLGMLWQVSLVYVFLKIGDSTFSMHFYDGGRSSSRPSPCTPPSSPPRCRSQTYHWNEDAKWENYYKALEAKQKS